MLNYLDRASCPYFAHFTTKAEKKGLLGITLEKRSHDTLKKYAAILLIRKIPITNKSAHLSQSTGFAWYANRMLQRNQANPNEVVARTYAREDIGTRAHVQSEYRAACGDITYPDGRRPPVSIHACATWNVSNARVPFVRRFWENFQK